MTMSDQHLSTDARIDQLEKLLSDYETVIGQMQQDITRIVEYIVDFKDKIACIEQLLNEHGIFR